MTDHYQAMGVTSEQLATMSSAELRALAAALCHGAMAIEYDATTFEYAVFDDGLSDYVGYGTSEDAALRNVVTEYQGRDGCREVSFLPGEQ